MMKKTLESTLYEKKTPVGSSEQPIEIRLTHIHANRHLAFQIKPTAGELVDNVESAKQQLREGFEKLLDAMFK